MSPPHSVLLPPALNHSREMNPFLLHSTMLHNCKKSNGTESSVLSFFSYELYTKKDASNWLLGRHFYVQIEREKGDSLQTLCLVPPAKSKHSKYFYFLTVISAPVSKLNSMWQNLLVLQVVYYNSLVGSCKTCVLEYERWNLYTLWAVTTTMRHYDTLLRGIWHPIQQSIKHHGKMDIKNLINITLYSIRCSVSGASPGLFHFHCV